MKIARSFMHALAILPSFFAAAAWAQDLPNQNVHAPKASRGNTVPISESTIINYCGDFDGCSVRLSMFDWDGARRVASREFMFFYNGDNGNWRTSLDVEGRNGAASTQHVFQSFSCYFTDGEYSGFVDRGDTQRGFGLLSWNEFDAECLLTLVD